MPTCAVPASPEPSPEILRGEATMDEAMQDGWTKDLSVLPAHVDEDAGDLLARWFSDMVREARQRFEVIVADTPPLLGTDDARTLASMASGVLLVISARSLTETVNEAVLSLETLNAPMLGVLGNRLRESRHHYY
jgi:Mrp family chromosome partitioning ATPase